MRGKDTSRRLTSIRETPRLYQLSPRGDGTASPGSSYCFRPPAPFRGERLGTARCTGERKRKWHSTTCPWRNNRGLGQRFQDPFNTLQQEMNRLFDSFWGT